MLAIDKIDLIKIYKQMPKEKLQDELDAIFDHVFAILEAYDCNSMEMYPSTNLKIRISCESMQDGNTYLC